MELAEVNKAPKERWVLVDRAGMTSKLDQFDAIVDISRVRHDGIGPNAVDKREGSVDYRFYSPSRFAAAEKLSEVSEEAVHDGFRMWIRDDKVSAMITNVKPETCTYTRRSVGSVSFGAFCFFRLANTDG